jgi:hypothetical protein
VTPSSRRRPAGCWTSTRAAGTASGCIPATRSSAPTRRRSCRRCGVATRSSRPRGDGRGSSSTSTAAEARYLAAVDVHHPARGLFGRCEARISSPGFDALVNNVMTTEPYASAQHVFWIPTTAPSIAGNRRSMPSSCVAEPRIGAPPHACLVAQPDRDLLLDPDPQGAHAGRLRCTRGRRRAHSSPSSASSPPRPPRSAGRSPAATSTPSSTASISAAG